MTEDDISRLVEVWQHRLGLSMWDIKVTFVEQTENNAVCHRSTMFERATIEIGAHLLTDDGQLSDEETLPIPTGEDRPLFVGKCVVHEMLHCVFRDLRDGAVDSLDDLLLRDVFRLYESRYVRAEEQTIDRLAVVLVEAFEDG